MIASSRTKDLGELRRAPGPWFTTCLGLTDCHALPILAKEFIVDDILRALNNHGRGLADHYKVKNIAERLG
jgi:hypothetical protein